MKIVLFDLNHVAALDRWSRDANCVAIALKPLEGIPADAWARPPMELTRYELLAKDHVALFGPMLEDGLRNLGPRLPGAEISLPAGADHAIVMASRLDYPLLHDLEASAKRYPIESVELVTDEADGGRCYQAARDFARTKRFAFQFTHLGSGRRPAAQRVAAALEVFSATLHPAGPALVESLRSAVKRFGSQRSAAGIAGKSAEANGRRGPKLRAAMLVYTPKSWRYLLPIREKMLIAGHEVVLISPRLECDDALRKLGLPFVSIPDRLPREGFYRKSKEYFHQVPLAARDNVTESLAGPHGALRRTIVRLGIKATKIYSDLAEVLPKLFREHGTNVVLGTDSGSVAGRCLFRTAERMEIPSIFIQHGALIVRPGLAEYFTNSHQLLWGTSSRDRVIEAGIANPEQIDCIGSPFLETQLVVDPATHAAATDGPVLVGFSVPGGFGDDSGYLRAAREVFRAAQSLPAVPFVIKPHPGDHTKVWERLSSAAGLPNVTISRRDTYDLMKECRILLTMFSTAGAEAIYLEKPVVSVDLEHADLGTDFLAAGAAYVVDCKGQLAPLVARLLSESPGSDPLIEKRREFAKAFLHREEKPAAERIVHYLEQIVLNPQESRKGQPIA